MKIIGHRGARGLATENTAESITKSLSLGVQAVEFDVRTTEDGVPVLHHDRSLRRITGDRRAVSRITWGQLQQLRTKNNQPVPSAEEILDLIPHQQIYFEVKDKKVTPGVVELLTKNAGKDIVITSFNWHTAQELKNKLPNFQYYAATGHRPIKVVSFALKHGFSGITLAKQLFNPLTYWLAKNAGLRVALFPVNSRIFVRLLKLCRFDVDIYTDYPNKFLHS